jgi:hypothetical protein
VKDSVSTEEEAKICRTMDGKLGKYGFPAMGFEPYEDEEEKGEKHFLATDFSEIYSNLKEGLVEYRLNTKDNIENAIWHWWFLFENHWGHHIILAMPAIYWLYVNKPFEE